MLHSDLDASISVTRIPPGTRSESVQRNQQAHRMFLALNSLNLYIMTSFFETLTEECYPIRAGYLSPAIRLFGRGGGHHVRKDHSQTFSPSSIELAGTDFTTISPLTVK
jgi:hypothetical protein